MCLYTGGIILGTVYVQDTPEQPPLTAAAESQRQIEYDNDDASSQTSDDSSRHSGRGR